MTKKRDKEYGPKPQDVPLKRDEMTKSPAKLSQNYCKKGKAEHIFELNDVMGYSRLWCMKTYYCTVCGKKKRSYKRKEN
jgi:hypothetical protein